MDISLRSEKAADIFPIEAVIVAAFLNAPHTSHTEQFIVHALRKSGKLAVSLVAELEGTVVGHAAASPVSISDGATGWFGLGPISVMPEYQRRGIGSRLVSDALQALRERSASGCVVLGERDFYGRFGFRSEASLVLRDVPAEYFQVLSFGSSLPRGLVTYDVAFSAQIDDARVDCTMPSYFDRPPMKSSTARLNSSGCSQ
jgi:putative acetyltransferase